MRAANAAATAVFLVSVGVGSPAFAQNYKQTQVFSVKNSAWEIVPTAPFQRFGNNVVGDCQYETAANLTLAEFPKTKITTNEVESAFNKYGMNWVGPLWEGQRFLEFQGFGHRAVVSPVSTNLDYYANHGGLEVTIMGNMEHELGIIQAKGQEMTVVDDGYIYHYTWASFAAAYPGDQLDYFSVVWR